jgi:hypothetical protein
MAFTPIVFTGGETGTCPGWLSGSASTSAKYTGNFGIVQGTGSYYGEPIYNFNWGVPLDEVYLTFWMCPREYTVQETTETAFKIFFHLTDGNTISIQCFSYPRLYINSTYIKSSTTALNGSFQNWKIGFKIADAPNGWFKMYLDGNLVIDYTGDTKPGSATQADYMYTKKYLNYNYCSQWYDDIFIGTGGFPGDLRVLGKTLTSDVQKEFLNNGQSSLIPPESTPTLIEDIAGNLTGTYKYKVTFVDNDGETLAGPESSPITVTSKKVSLTNIPLGGLGCTNRKVYRTANNGSVFKLLTVIADNTTTTYLDNITDSSLGVNEPVWTNFSAIDETTPSDTDYLWTKSNGKRSLFGLSSVDWTNKTPVCMNIIYRAKKDTTNTQKIKVVRKMNSVVGVEAGTALTTSFQQYNTFFVTDTEGNPLSTASIESLQIGIESEVPV